MVLSTKKVAVLVSMVVLALGIGLMGAVGFASPKDNDAHHNNDKGRSTLTVLVKTRELEAVDLGPQGPSHGDMRIVNGPLHNESGKKKVGRLDLFCITTDPADESAEKAHMAECTKTFTLPSGEISVQGREAYPDELSARPAPGEDAIIGGTGKYAGVRGVQRFEPRRTKGINTFHFIG